MSIGNPRAPAESRQLARVEYLAWLNPTLDVQPFEYAIRVLVPTRRTSHILALFHNRVHRGTIQNWRCGARRPPQWAIDILADKLTARAAEYSTVVTSLRASRAE